MKNKIQTNPSENAKKLAARMAAVQGVYQSLQTGQSLESVLSEFLSHRKTVESQDGPIGQPDGILLTFILEGVGQRREDLENIVKSNFSKENKSLEPLLQAVLLCGTYELIAGQTDKPIIINDYLNVTHAFYEAGEVSLVNGILDSIAKTV